MLLTNSSRYAAVMWLRLASIIGCSAASAQQPPMSKAQLPEGVYRIGNGVSAPVVIQKEEPQYSAISRSWTGRESKWRR